MMKDENDGEDTWKPYWLGKEMEICCKHKVA